jgi:hypothetical protein
VGESSQSVLERCFRSPQQVNEHSGSLRFMSLTCSVICLVFRKNWGYLFNSDPEVVAVVARVLPYIALFQVS